VLVYLSLSGNAQEKTNRLRVASPYGHLPGFRVDGLIAKSNDDLRQEVLLRILAVLDELYVGFSSGLEPHSKCHIYIALTHTHILFPILSLE
jgi:hypothetical protein